jgi:hypothetical protein
MDQRVEQVFTLDDTDPEEGTSSGGGAFRSEP